MDFRSISSCVVSVYSHNIHNRRGNPVLSFVLHSYFQEETRKQARIEKRLNQEAERDRVSHLSCTYTLSLAELSTVFLTVIRRLMLLLTNITSIAAAVIWRKASKEY